MKSTRFWIILTAAVLAVCLAASLLVLGGSTHSTTAYVYQGGELLRTIDLSQVDDPFSFTVDGPAGTNTVQVEPGRIRVARADCPDQVCVNQGWISNGVVPIVCLPNELVIQIAGGTAEPEIDGVSG